MPNLLKRALLAWLVLAAPIPALAQSSQAGQPASNAASNDVNAANNPLTLKVTVNPQD